MADSPAPMQEETQKTKAAEKEVEGIVDSPVLGEEGDQAKGDAKLVEEEMRASEQVAQKEQEFMALIDSIKGRVPSGKMRELMALPAAAVRVAVRKIGEMAIHIPDWAQEDAQLVGEIQRSSVGDQWARIMKDAETEGNFVWSPLVVVAELPLAEQAKAQKLVSCLCWAVFYRQEIKKGDRCN